MRGHDFVGVLHIAMGRDRDRLGHRQDDVRLRDVPSFSPLRRRGRVMRIACRSAGRDPGQRRRNLLRRERRIVGEVAESRVGKPWRHHSALNCLCDSRRPGPGLLVRHQRHGRDFAGTMTALAVALQQGKNVFIESRGCFCGYWKRGGCSQNRCGDKSSCRTDAGPHAKVYKADNVRCHPERSGRLRVSRSCRAVEGPL